MLAASAGAAGTALAADAGVTERESAAAAQALIAACCRDQGIVAEQLTVHADRGSPMVFSTAAGSRFVDDLLLLVSRGELEPPATRETVLLALGSASDQDSLAALRAAAAGADLRLAGAAVRALAARPDGTADALAALDDPNPALRAAAEFALAHVMPRLEPAQLADLEQRARSSPSLSEALAHHRRR